LLLERGRRKREGEEQHADRPLLFSTSRAERDRFLDQF
jgi:hypothetical protein